SAILNAANEIAVNEFLQKNIRFTDIANVIETVLENVTQHEATSLDVILEDDKLARGYAMQTIKGMQI
ncbi:MAG: 1-deoxy-D-xylulose-5-phosphate reductoisomerase, partial [Gammaproteobacteria bacterium]